MISTVVTKTIHSVVLGSTVVNKITLKSSRDSHSKISALRLAPLRIWPSRWTTKRDRALSFLVHWQNPGFPGLRIPGRLASARRRGTRDALQGRGQSSPSSQRRFLLRIRYGGPPRPGADEAAASPGQAAAAVPCSSLSRRRPLRPCQHQAHQSPRGSAGFHHLAGFRLWSLRSRRQTRW